MTPADIKDAGRRAYLAGQKASDCPYTFDRSSFWARKDYIGFDTVRWKLDAWMAGWIEEQRAASRKGAK